MGQFSEKKHTAIEDRKNDTINGDGFCCKTLLGTVFSKKHTLKGVSFVKNDTLEGGVSAIYSMNPG